MQPRASPLPVNHRYAVKRLLGREPMLLNDVRKHLVHRYMGGVRTTQLVMGQPGVGKTYIIPEAADEVNRAIQRGSFDLVDDNGRPIEHFQYKTLGGAANKDPIDLPGIPAVERQEDGPTYAIRAPFRGNGDEIPTEGAGFLAIEDVTSVQAPVVMAGLQSLLWERRVGATVLGKNWMIVGTGNRVSDRAGSQRLITSLKSRCNILTAEPDHDGWQQYMATTTPQGAVVIRAFLKNMPQYFNKFDPNNDDQFPCPRTWHNLSQEILAYNHGDPLGNHLPHDEVIAGWIGTGPMIDFMAFATLYRSIVTPAEILANPEKANIPKEVGAIYAVCTALSTQATPDNFDRMVVYLFRLAPEYAVYCVKSALLAEDAQKAKLTPEAQKKFREIAQTVGFGRFAQKYHNLMIAS